MDTSGPPEHHDYQSYLLRLWRDGARSPWRATLQCTTTEQIFPFATMDSLLAFLTARLKTAEDRGDDRQEI